MTDKRIVVEQHLIRHGGHPWDGMKRPNFDLLEINTTNKDACDQFVEAAKRKYWKPWLIGVSEDGKEFGGLLYKPSGMNCPWDDSFENPHPGGVAAQTPPEA